MMLKILLLRGSDSVYENNNNIVVINLCEVLKIVLHFLQ